MATAARAIAPFDVSDETLYVEDSWRDKFAKLRAEMPVSYCPESPFGPYWSVVTHDLVRAVELDWETYSSSYKNGNIVIADPPPESNLPNFIAADPPTHTEQRKVITPAFSPSQMHTREEQVVGLCTELFDGLPHAETFDWVDRVSIPLTMGMLCILFDIPLDERPQMKLWSDYAGGVSSDHLTDEWRAEWMQHMQSMLARFDQLFDARREADPADDLINRMVHSDAMGNMNPFERLANIALLIVGGNDTTRNSMSGLIAALNEFPQELDKLQADAALIPNAAQEIIRWQSPVLHMRRTAMRDTELDGQHIAKGEKVVMWYISANRDESIFEDADRFDVTRINARRHLAFGHGVHRCVGARLAEIQIGTVINQIVERNWRVVQDGRVERVKSPFLRAFSTMPVRIDKRG
ncbi:cytochrome P450 [uncultured Erythrobacter sp.]|uniref:cytochrome P450 n=1 Tax=uncultured Erythrobacter sp. TaxID=263913 RepID=UPI0026040365|nr:cytochrome P450 [uncultured Erythrobacter sp.]